MPDLPMADQNAFELLHSYSKSLKWFVCEKTARPIFMQLLAVYHAKKQHLENIFTRRTMQSSIRLFVFEFS
jgi:hypothetical protein